jgi:hypothetical protein
MRIRMMGFAVVFATGLLAGSTWQTRAAQTRNDPACGAASTPQVRTTLYFGMARPKGSVSELEWQLFLRDEVTSRFPDGLTVWDAQGQWRGAAGTIDHEQAKVLLLVHPDTAAARQAVQAVITQYRQRFDQEGVLWEEARVCAAS